MSAPSPPFSSFPAFSSFPDIEPGSSKSKQEPSSAESEKREKSKRSRDQDKSRDRWKRGRHGHEDEDERRKKKSKKSRGDRERQPEDNHAPASHESRRHPSALAEDLAYRSFYSDRKGDILNVTYGGVHAGDVPKYHLVAREYHALLCNDR